MSLNTNAIDPPKPLRESVCVLVILALFVSLPSLAQTSTISGFLKERALRVVVRDPTNGKSKAATAFLWQNSEQVITSLHAVLPCEDCIVIECGDNRYRATVQKYLRQADLVLLKPNRPIQACRPYTLMNEAEPAEETSLYTWGYHAGIKFAKRRKMEKSEAEPETLEGLVANSQQRELLKQIGIPGFNEPIYYVENGLLPGYSGGAVINKQKELVGIVDGGLNAGQDGVNWIIPAGNINKLITQGSPPPVPAGVRKLSMLFASGIAEPTARDVIQYYDESAQREFQWVRTKTQTLTDLRFSAHDQDGIYNMINRYADAASINSYDQLVFDIYQEEGLNLILALPNNSTLKYSNIGDDVKPWFILNAVAPSSGSGAHDIQYQYGNWDVTNDLQQVIHPSDPNYFQHFIAELLIGCHTPGESYCVLDPGTLRMIDFGQGNKILTMGTKTLDYFDTQKALIYDYYSFAVKNGTPFGAQVRIFPDQSDGLFPCLTQVGQGQCRNSQRAREQLALLMAVQLTTITGLDSGNQQRYVSDTFVYDSSGDYRNTFNKRYYEGDKLRLYNTRGKEWFVYGDELTPTVAVEARRDGDTAVILRKGDSDFLYVPINGGAVYRSRSTAPDEWEQQPFANIYVAQ